jgi:hypothetical protein
MMAEVKKVGELIPSLTFEGEKVQMGEILNKDVVITNFGLQQGQYGEFAVIEFHFPQKSEKFVTVCGGKVVIKKLNKLAELVAFPVQGKFVKVKRYYDLV